MNAARELIAQPDVGVLNEHLSQLSQLSGVAVQARQCTYAGTVSRPSYVAWRAGMATPLSGLS